MTIRGMKIRKDLLRAACMLAPTMTDQRAFVDIVRQSEDAGESEDQTVGRLIRAMDRAVNHAQWPGDRS